MSKTIFSIVGLSFALSFGFAPTVSFAHGHGDCENCKDCKTVDGKKMCPHHAKNGKKKDCGCGHEHKHDKDAKKEVPKS